MSDPTIFRKFQYTDLKGNNNKYWQIKWWDDGTLETAWGRVGASPQHNVKKHTRQSAAETMIRKKLDKGYVEIDLHKPAVVAGGNGQTYNLKVQDLIDLIYKEAGEYIKSYLAMGVDTLSQKQIQHGRDLLAQLDIVGRPTIQMAPTKATYQAVELAEQYYNTIPTQLPSRIDPMEAMNDLVTNLAEHAERLDQLEAALDTYAVQGTSNQIQALGADLDVMDQADPVYHKVADYVQRTSGGMYRLKDVFKVCIPKERQAWEQETRGKQAVSVLWHGTHNKNVRHIVRSGLIIPPHAANGSRFGRGIYFADQARRSLSYTGGNYYTRILFATEVALGIPWKLDGTDSSLNARTVWAKGYDSVWGVKAWSGMDEFIVYSPTQQTIRAIVTLE